MIQIEMSKDIRDFSPKVISVFDLRQIICIGIAASYGIPFVMSATAIELTTRITIAVIIMMPVILCGWIKIYGMPFEKFITHMLINRFLTPEKRYYKSECKMGFLDTDKTIPKDFSTIKRPKMTRKEKKGNKAALKKYGACS